MDSVSGPSLFSALDLSDMIKCFSVEKNMDEVKET